MKRFVGALSVVMLAGLMALSAAAQTMPEVAVSDQAILNGTVTVEKVVSAGLALLEALPGTGTATVWPYVLLVAGALILVSGLTLAPARSSGRQK